MVFFPPLLVCYVTARTWRIFLLLRIKEDIVKGFLFSHSHEWTSPSPAARSDHPGKYVRESQDGCKTTGTLYFSSWQWWNSWGNLDSWCSHRNTAVESKQQQHLHVSRATMYIHEVPMSVASHPSNPISCWRSFLVSNPLQTIHLEKFINRSSSHCCAAVQVLGVLLCFVGFILDFLTCVQNTHRRRFENFQKMTHLCRFESFQKMHLRTFESFQKMTHLRRWVSRSCLCGGEG